MTVEVKLLILIHDYIYERAGAADFPAALRDAVEVFSVQLVYLSVDALCTTNPVTQESLRNIVKKGIDVDGRCVAGLHDLRPFLLFCISWVGCLLNSPSCHRAGSCVVYPYRAFDHHTLPWSAIALVGYMNVMKPTQTHCDIITITTSLDATYASPVTNENPSPSAQLLHSVP